MNDNVNHPSHYTQFEHEVITLTRELPFDAGNCVKYIVRSPFKGRTEEDLKKALWYCKDFITHPKKSSPHSNREHAWSLACFFATKVSEYKHKDALMYSKLLLYVVGACFSDKHSYQMLCTLYEDITHQK